MSGSHSAHPGFSLIGACGGSQARAGKLLTKRGIVETPVFMPVGTAGTVKALTAEQLKAMDAQIILANTYHLCVRPGPEIIRGFGSFHRFASWDRPILTDSGGFQIFSLEGMSRITRDGVHFRSHLDGSPLFFTPESVVDFQILLDSDIQMVLDYFARFPSSREEDEKAMQLTLQWAERSRNHFLKNPCGNLQFAIVQGGLFEDLRSHCLQELQQIGFDGYAIGGLSVGESRSDFRRILSHLVPGMPQEFPRYLMGAGTPEEILLAVNLGVDMFDCVLPSRNARNGTLFTSRGKIRIKNERYKMDASPLDEDCGCYTCRNHSRAYLRHLYISKEISASILNTIHNVYFYLDFMKKIRYSILSNRFMDFTRQFLSRYKGE